MKQPDNQHNDIADIREQIIGLGERSIRKSYYPELQEKLGDLERFKTLLDQSNDAIFLTDIPSGRLIYGSKSACSQISASEEECRSLSIYDILLDNTEKLNEIFSGATDSIIFDAVFLKKSGEKTPCELNMRTVTFRDRKYVVAIARDITERKRAEEELRESEGKFRALTESSTAAIIVYQGEWLVSANPAAERITGYSREELMKMRTVDIIHPEFKEMVANRAFARQRGEPEPSQYEVKIITKSGELRWVLISVGLMVYRGKPAGVINMLDITERKHVEEALRRSEVLLAKSQDIAHLGSYEWDIVHNNDKWSDEMYRLFGVQPGEVKPSLETYLNFLHPDDRELVKKHAEKIIKYRKYTGGYEARIVRPDSTIRWIRFDGELVPDKSGKRDRMIGTIIDITERKQAEEALKDAKDQAELYLDVMSHDITNMNQALMGYLEVMEAMRETGEIDKTLIDNSIGIITRSSRMISDVKKLTRLQAGKVPRKDVDLCKILSKVKSRYSSVPNRQVTINYTPGVDCMVRAGDMLEDVFDNLVDNAIRHSAGPVTIDIAVEKAVPGGHGYYHVTVADNGPGIPDEQKKKVFLTIKEIAVGERRERRGFGLYLVRMLVDFYHGKVWVEDRVPGDYTKGARFEVTLPAAER